MKKKKPLLDIANKITNLRERSLVTRLQLDQSTTTTFNRHVEEYNNNRNYSSVATRITCFNGCGLVAAHETDEACIQGLQQKLKEQAEEKINLNNTLINEVITTGRLLHQLYERTGENPSLAEIENDVTTE